jgi:hypothetical protein
MVLRPRLAGRWWRPVQIKNQISRIKSQDRRHKIKHQTSNVKDQKHLGGGGDWGLKGPERMSESAKQSQFVQSKLETGGRRPEALRDRLRRTKPIGKELQV